MRSDYVENKERDQDRVEASFDHFKRWGFVIFPENQRIYENIANEMSIGTILEAGCGSGTGAGILSRSGYKVTGTDKLAQNVKFAQALYPWIQFDQWDVAERPYYKKHSVVVCVEAIEHIKDYRAAVKNLIDSAHNEVWISTPNGGRTDEKQPSNEFHVREFTVDEMLEIIGKHKVEIYHWDTMEKLDKNTKVHPLIYKIIHEHRPYSKVRQFGTWNFIPRVRQTSKAT